MSDVDPKILCVAPAYPWPPTDGYRNRLAHMIAGLADVGHVDFIAVCEDGSPVTATPPPSERIRVVELAQSPLRTRRQWMPEWTRSGRPRAMLNGRMVDAAAQIGAHLGGPYDLAYYSNLDTWDAFGSVVDAPTIVDFDNLQNLILNGRRRRAPVFADAGPLEIGKVAAEWVVSRGFDLVDERRWDKAQRHCAEHVAAVTVCSDLDVLRSGCTNAYAVPNGYERTAVPRVDHKVAKVEPVITFVGLLSYEPNADAARWFATDILPRLRRQIPHVTFRIVGSGGEAISALGRLPGVTVVGQVPSVGPELERSDLVVVPIRFGAGTRLKVVEALANRVPCVSTTMGSEGIDVVDGRHVLLADDADSFVKACGRVLADVELRTTMIAEGEALFTDRYQWSNIRGRLSDLARKVIANAEA